MRRVYAVLTAAGALIGGLVAFPAATYAWMDAKYNGGFTDQRRTLVHGASVVVIYTALALVVCSILLACARGWFGTAMGMVATLVGGIFLVSAVAIQVGGPGGAGYSLNDLGCVVAALLFAGGLTFGCGLWAYSGWQPPHAR